LRTAARLRHNRRMSQRPHRLRRILTAFLFTSFLLQGCSQKPANEHRYELKGKVVSVDRAKGEVTVDHGEVKGYMPAMTMPFPVRDAEALKVLEAGDQLQASLVITDEGYWLDSPVITKGPAGGANATPPAGTGEPQPGAEVPDVKLVNQDGRPLNLRQFKGRALVVTFIYTRCPLPDYCPRMVENFKVVRARFADRMNRDLVLLTVSFDPKYDTPERLAAYALANRAVTPGWHFLTGDPAQVERVCDAFGIQYFAEEGLITHSLHTAVIGRDGRLAATVEGKAFTPAQLGDVIDSVLAGR
jgi:protein SCO1